MAAEHPNDLVAEDLIRVVNKLSPEEQLRLAYYALRRARGVAAPGAAGGRAAISEGLPDMAEFHASFEGAPYPGNSVIEMREEDDR